jgi:hypothetical protein
MAEEDMESRGPGGSRWRMDGTPVAPQQFEGWDAEEFQRSENGLEITKMIGGGLSPYRTAVWGQPLAGGRPGSGGVGRRHLSVFTIVKPSQTSLLFGVVKSSYDVQTGMDAHEESGHCFYSAGNGKKFPGWEDWAGQESMKLGDQIGLLLDRDAGSMAVYKNDRLLGVMQTEGLNGEYRWAVAMSHKGGCVRIECLPPRYYIELEEAKEQALRDEELKEKERKKAAKRKADEQKQREEAEAAEAERLQRAEAALAALEGGGAE